MNEIENDNNKICYQIKEHLLHEIYNKVNFNMFDHISLHVINNVTNSVYHNVTIKVGCKSMLNFLFKHQIYKSIEMKDNLI
jgi:hypothetical protein